ncbi:hypothetical protein FA09DRAFT_122420 [Tilletiopsis washingtonensis]|uniref:C2H2-type domain-containing protein n=1 Tax=Tilletiopsis washingtonensis TaxID=58919 RepID=A0A316ZGU3_9BASI|nr:hypothetical protein FA09DRAFT_122420 [Tilletiopsis washingtonensis]PWO00998.1 hypothetical protein FA09DRAFT_122420 [Tilletiopsis washingtonensis]
MTTAVRPRQTPEFGYGDLSRAGSSGAAGPSSSGTSVLAGDGMASYGGYEGGEELLPFLDDPSALLSSTSVGIGGQELSFSTDALDLGFDVSAGLEEDENGLFRFPDLPSSLLDQAPEYEYSTHTRTNVFEAVQDFAGDQDAARLLGLDEYDTSLSSGLQLDGSWGSYIQDSTPLGATPGVMAPADAGLGVAIDEAGPRSLQPDAMARMYAEGTWPGALPTNSPPSLRPAEAAAAAVEPRRRRDSVDNPQGSSASENSAWPSRAASAVAMSAPANPFAPPTQAPFVAPQQGFESISMSDRQFNGRRPPPPTDPSVAASLASAPAGTNGRSRMASWTDGSQRSSVFSDYDSSFEFNGQMNGAALAMPPAAARVGNYAMGPPAAGNYVQSQPALVTLGPDGQPQLVSQTPRLSIASEASGSRSFSAGPNGDYGDAGMHMALGSSMDASLDSEGVAKCPYPRCDKTFAKNRSYNLKAHLRSHSQLKPFACTHCPRAFSRKHDLERHARVHSGDKPYLCEACNKGFPRSDALRRHWRVEKECGERAAEIEAGQPLPSLPPGHSAILASAPGMMMGHSGGSGGGAPHVTHMPYEAWQHDPSLSGYESSDLRYRKRMREDC